MNLPLDGIPNTWRTEPPLAQRLAPWQSSHETDSKDIPKALKTELTLEPQPAEDALEHVAGTQTSLLFAETKTPPLLRVYKQSTECHNIHNVQDTTQNYMVYDEPGKSQLTRRKSTIITNAKMAQLFR